jgi:hypothetical protein
MHDSWRLDGDSGDRRELTAGDLEATTAAVGRK